MLIAQTTESRFALLFVQAKKTKIENSLGIKHLDILIVSWIVYNFIVKNRDAFQSAFRHNIDIYAHDILLSDIITVLKQAQKRGISLQDELPFPPEKIHIVI